MRKFWRQVLHRAYSRDMGGHKGSRRLDRVSQPEDLRSHAGHWVAVKDGRIVAAAETSLKLVSEVQRLGAEGSGAVAQFVAPHNDAIVIGVG